MLHFRENCKKKRQKKVVFIFVFRYIYYYSFVFTYSRCHLLNDIVQNVGLLQQCTHRILSTDSSYYSQTLIWLTQWLADLALFYLEISACILALPLKHYRCFVHENIIFHFENHNVPKIAFCPFFGNFLQNEANRVSLRNFFLNIDSLHASQSYLNSRDTLYIFLTE